MVANMKQYRPDSAKSGSDGSRLTKDVSPKDIAPPSEMHLRGEDLKHVTGTPVGQKVTLHVQGTLVHHTNQPKNSATPWEQNSARVKIDKIHVLPAGSIPAAQQPKMGKDEPRGKAK